MRGGRYFLYGCGQLGVMALTRFFFQWLITFAGDESQGAGTALFVGGSVGALFFAFRIFDGVTDPVAGVASDWWVGRGRERRSLLWLSFALPPIGLALIFAPNADMSTTLRWVCMSGGMFVFFVGYTFYAIPYWSLIDDYSGGDPRTRARLSNVLGTGVLLATGFGFVLSPLLIDSVGFFSGALIWAAPCSLLMVLPYFAQPRQVRGFESKGDSKIPWHAFKLAWRHKRFRAVVVLFAGGQMSFTVMTAAAPFIAIDLLDGDKADVALLLGPFLLTALPAFIAVPRLTARFGWERAVVIATLCLGGVYAGAGLLGVTLVVSPLVTAACVFALGGPMAAVLLGLEGEAITASAAEQGGKVTSVYFGVYNLVVKALNGLALFSTDLLAAVSREHGSFAVRAMGVYAGMLLVIGVVLYFRLRPTAAEPIGSA
jgi:Na+/melibiose symporter-like transporter